MAPSKPVDGAEQAASDGARADPCRDLVSTNGASGDVALSVRDLVGTFEVGGGWLGGERGEVSAVAGVSFDIGSGQTLGLAGESGCGKSTTARCILRLIEPTSGDVVLHRRIDEGGAERIDVIAAGRGELRRLRRHMEIVFQDPFASRGSSTSRCTPTLTPCYPRCRCPTLRWSGGGCGSCSRAMCPGR